MGARLGQHFLKHAWAASTLAHAVPLEAGERFVEVGPGKGILTRELLKLGPVTAIEKDAALIPLLQDAFAKDIASGRLEIVSGDIRTVHPQGKFVVAANIPYYITGDIIRHFLTGSPQPRAMALLIQKEVADRILARDDKESLLSLSVKAYGVPRAIARVSRTHFSPPPKVDSTILAIEKISRNFFAELPEERFFSVLHAGFASKRKQLAPNLARVFGSDSAHAALQLTGIDPRVRAEDVSLDDWKRLAQHLTDSSRA